MPFHQISTEILPQQESLYPIGLKSTRIKIPKSVSFLSQKRYKCKNVKSFYSSKNCLLKNAVTTGSLVSKRDNVSSIYRVFELKMRKTKVICMFIGNGHLTIDPWIWLKVTFLSSTASVLKDSRILLEIPSFYSFFYFF